MVIISDTAYASFVEEFQTFGNELPKKILGVYSFSKYFGVTGWRLGVIMVHKGPKWSLRVVLTNIYEKDCRLVGEAIVAVMEKYHQKLS